MANLWSHDSEGYKPSSLVVEQTLGKRTKTDSGPVDQRDRFEQAARELGVDLDEEKLKETLRKIVPDRKPGTQPSEQKKD